MARVSPYELGNVAAFVYEAAKGSPGEWSSPGRTNSGVFGPGPELHARDFDIKLRAALQVVA
jgi:hypothetical protein